MIKMSKKLNKRVLKLQNDIWDILGKYESKVPFSELLKKVFD